VARVVRGAARARRHPDDLTVAFGDHEHPVLVEILDDGSVCLLERLHRSGAGSERHPGALRLGVQPRQGTRDIVLAARDDPGREAGRYETSTSCMMPIRNGGAIGRILSFRVLDSLLPGT